MASELKTPNDLHIARKLFHLMTLFSIALCMIYLSPETCWTMYFIVGVPVALMDYARRFSPAWNQFCHKVIGPFIRKSEHTYLTGSSFATVSVGIVYLAFPKQIAALSVLFLAIGDPLASLFGNLYGKRKIIGDKSLSGSLAAFIACAVTAFLYFQIYPWQGGPQELITHFVLALVLGLIGSFSEAFTLFGLDDNFTQPLMSACLMTVLFGAWGVIVHG
jgi:diacylglycerol kinase (CTP)